MANILAVTVALLIESCLHAANSLEPFPPFPGGVGENENIFLSSPNRHQHFWNLFFFKNSLAATQFPVSSHWRNGPRFDTDKTGGVGFVSVPDRSRPTASVLDANIETKTSDQRGQWQCSSSVPLLHPAAKSPTKETSLGYESRNVKAYPWAHREYAGLKGWDRKVGSFWHLREEQKREAKWFKTAGNP